jgi:hypothetical protein
VEANVGRNNVNMHLPDNLASLVVIESRLFQRLLVGIANSLLIEQSNCHLGFDIQVVENNADKQSIRLNFMVHNASNVNKLTLTVNQLALGVNGERAKNAKTLAYLQDLMLVFNVSNIESATLETGVKFSLEMPIVNAGPMIDKTSVISRGLANKNIVILATSTENELQIKAALQGNKANVETLKDSSLIGQRLSVKNLTKQRIDALVVSPEVHLSDHDAIVQWLNSLPTKLQPKLMVIQPAFNTPLHRTGLFSQSTLPWLHDEFAENLLTLLNSQQSSNRVVASDILMQCRHGATQVEVLLAVKKPQQHSNLLCLLHWLGLQIKVVCHSHSLDKHWQTGRYLVLISEFATSPVVPMAIGHQLRRGAFYFAKPDFLNEIQAPEAWSIGQFPESIDIQAMSQLLEPWLSPVSFNAPIKPKSTPNTSDNSHHPDKSITKAIESISDDVVDIARSEATIPLSKQEGIVDELLLEQGQIDDNEQVFDLAAYAKNQGSAELAVFMLDDYLVDIEKHMLDLNQAIETRHANQAQQAVNKLLKLTRVLSAEDYHHKCQQLELILTTNSKTKITLVQQKELLIQFKQLKDCRTQLFDFAQAI